MGTIAGLLITGDSIEDTLAQIKTEVKPHEVRLMTEFGIANDDGDIDKGKFLTASAQLLISIRWWFLYEHAGACGMSTYDCFHCFIFPFLICIHT